MIRKTCDMKVLVFAIWGLYLIVGMTGCSVKKYIPEDEYLYSEAKLDLDWEEEPDDKNRKEEEIRSVLYPKHNSRILGIRTGLYIPYKADNNPNIINRSLTCKW